MLRVCSLSSLGKLHHRTPLHHVLIIVSLIALGSGSAVAADGSDGDDPPLPKQTTTRIVEWDLPANADARPGAISIDTHGSNHLNNVWFATRDIMPRVYKLEIPRDLKIGNAKFKSWPLDPRGLGPTGGVKKLRASWDRRFVFIRTVTALQKVDTVTNLVTVYPDELFELGVSDLAVDDTSRVYFAARTAGTPTDTDPAPPNVGVISRINAGYHGCTAASCPPAELLRWEVGGGVGNCASNSGPTDPCLSGIAVAPRYPHLVYYSDPEGNYIGELDTKTNTKTCSSCPYNSSKRRRWSLSRFGDVTQPRQVNIDHDGIIWVVTGSGHLVSLDPKTDRMTKHKIPNLAFTDPFGVAPDGGVIGYTDNEMFDRHKVAMLIPRGKGITCPADTIWVPRRVETTQPVCGDATPTSGQVCPLQRTVPTQITSKEDGVYVEAMIDTNTNMSPTPSSRFPLGITPDHDRANGAFFFAVGVPGTGDFEEPPLVNRIGHARLTRDHHPGKHHRDDEDHDDDGKPRGHDDDDDDDGMKNDVDNDDDNDGIGDIFDDDDDNDGIKNGHDTKDGEEGQDNHHSELAAGQAAQFVVTAAANSLALIATAAANNALTHISLEVRKAATGELVGQSLAAPGTALLTIVAPAAGDYTVTVKNHALTAAEVATSVITRTPRLP